MMPIAGRHISNVNQDEIINMAIGIKSYLLAGKELNYNSIRNLNPKFKNSPPCEVYFKKLKKEI